MADPLLVDELRIRVDRRLAALVPMSATSPQGVAQAARYALLAPGKRIRPLLTLLAAAEYRADADDALDVACATEMVHTASLVLDDLPSMDDARLRRGQPAAHVRFGESTAILAAVALLNQAYATIGGCCHLPARTRVDLVMRLSAAIGFGGLVSGQATDLDERSSPLTMSGLERLNRQKTSVLFEAALELGARVAGIEGRRIAPLRRAAKHLGLAYQITDDLIDCAADSPARVPSKDIHQDRNKATVVSLLGIERARERVGHHLGEALRLLPKQPDGTAALRPYIMQAFGPGTPGLSGRLGSNGPWQEGSS